MKTPYQCAAVKAWNTIAPLAPSRIMSPALSLETLLQAAVKDAACSDFGTTTFIEPLEKLLESINTTGDLHPFGKFYVKKMITGILVNRLKLVELWKLYPEILHESIPSPIIILGLPRTGTSLLFNLLAQDPAHRYLSNWEATVSQVPPEGVYNYKQDPRRKLGKYLMKFQHYLAPQMDELHTFYLDGPEECTSILMQEFTTQALAGMFNAPSYSAWLDIAPHTATYYQHKRVLQTLQWKYPATRWVLKSPAHVEAIASVMEVYPDAHLVQMHRDPVKAVSSFASLCAAFRGICSHTIDFKELGSQAISLLAIDFERYLEQRRSYDPSRFLDLQYTDLVRAPLETTQQIYDHFGLTLSAEAEKHMKTFLAKDRKSKSSHRYSPQDFGLTPQLIRKRFKGYIDDFDIPEEN